LWVIVAKILQPQFYSFYKYLFQSLHSTVFIRVILLIVVFMSIWLSWRRTSFMLWSIFTCIDNSHNSINNIKDCTSFCRLWCLWAYGCHGAVHLSCYGAFSHVLIIVITVLIILRITPNKSWVCQDCIINIKNDIV